MKKLKEIKRPITYYDTLKHFIKRDKSVKTRIVEYSGTTTHRYGKGTPKGGYYQAKSNPLKRVRSDEVKVRKGVSSYYFWGKRIAKWDGKTLWLSNGGMESIDVCRRLAGIYYDIKSSTYKTEPTPTTISKFTRAKLRGGTNINISFHPEGYTLGAAVHIINSYPITLCGETQKILDFTPEQKEIYVSKLLRSRGPRGIFILSTIKSFGFKLTDKEKADIKVKQLKIFMDDKIDKGFLADLDDLPDFV